VADAVLELEGVEAAYGPSRALHGVTLAARKGEVVSLLGRNGAGKSTTLKSIVGLVSVIAGAVRYEGREITGWPPHRISRLGVGYVPEDRRIFADLTVAENLEVGARDGAKPEAVYRLFPRLAELARRRAGSLSGGEQQMLTVARTLMGGPRLLLLDEPSEGLAPLVVETLRQQLARLKGAGLTMVLAEQNVRFVSELGTRVYILENGMVRYRGTMAEFLADAEVRQAYLAV
jgi:branched-chain amino acid transport system ATP-binding protein